MGKCHGSQGGSPASAVVSPCFATHFRRNFRANSLRLQVAKWATEAWPPSDGTSAMVLVLPSLVDLHGFLSAILVDFDVLRRIADGLTRA